jgi:hypothetical protein
LKDVTDLKRVSLENSWICVARRRTEVLTFSSFSKVLGIIPPVKDSRSLFLVMF